MLIVPYKSVAAALVLAVLLGPIGVFYSTFLGGIVMCIFGLISVGTMASMKSPLPMVTVCLVGIVWAMAAVRVYNRKMLEIAIKGCLNEPKEKTTTKIKESRSFFRRDKNNAPKDNRSAEPFSTDEILETEENTTSWRL